MTKEEKFQAETPFPQSPQAGFAARLAVVLFNLAYMSLAVVLFIDGWLHDHGILRRIVAMGDESLPPLFASAAYSSIGALLGVGVLDLVSFHKYVAYEKDFQRAHVWGYFLSPWLATVSGLMVFVLLQGGLLVFAGSDLSGKSEDVANMGYVGIGFLTGFGWFHFVQRIEKMILHLFSKADTGGDGEAA